MTNIMLRPLLVALVGQQVLATTTDADVEETTTGRPATCGCGWRRHSACSISAHQYIQALQHSRVDEMCVATNGHGDPELTSADDNYLSSSKSRAEKECWMRMQIRKKAKSLEKCLDLTDPDKCNNMEGCAWEAQGSYECGVDEYRFIYDLLGEEAGEHPLLQALQVHEHCSSRDYNSCSAPHCQMRHGVCDLNPSIFFHMFMHRPSLVNMFILTNRGAMCRAYYEHGEVDGNGGCGEPCLLERGICRLNVDKVYHFPFRPNENQTEEDVTKQMVNALCMRLGKPLVYEGHPENATAECREPCTTITREVRGTQRTFCRGPETLPDDLGMNTKLGFTEKDWLVAESFMVLRSATMVFENHCHQFTDNYDMCQASNQNCHEDFKPEFTTAAPTAFPAGNASSAVGVKPLAPAGPAMKGFLHEVGQAAERGTLDKLFGDYLENYARTHKLDAEDKEEIKHDVDLLKNWMKAPKEEKWKPTEDKKTPWDGDEDEVGDIDEAIAEVGPGVIVGALLFAAVCGGLAIGVLCSTAMGGGPRDLRPQLLSGYSMDQESGMGGAQRASTPETLEAE